VWQAESFLISLCKVDFQNWINVCTKTQNVFIQNRIWDLVWKSFPRLKLQGWLFTFPGSSLLPHRTASGLSRFKRNIYGNTMCATWFVHCKKVWWNWPLVIKSWMTSKVSFYTVKWRDLWIHKDRKPVQYLICAKRFDFVTSPNTLSRLLSILSKLYTRVFCTNFLPKPKRN
jgi:hypothetical protein